MSARAQLHQPRAAPSRRLPPPPRLVCLPGTARSIWGSSASVPVGPARPWDAMLVSAADPPRPARADPGRAGRAAGPGGRRRYDVRRHRRGRAAEARKCARAQPDSPDLHHQRLPPGDARGAPPPSPPHQRPRALGLAAPQAGRRQAHGPTAPHSRVSCPGGSLAAALAACAQTVSYKTSWRRPRHPRSSRVRARARPHQARRACRIG